MFAFLKRIFGGSKFKPSLDAIQFDATFYPYQGEPEPGRVRTWRTPEGDGLGTFYFSIPPNLPTNAASANDLADDYSRLVERAGGRLVELALVTAGGCPAIWTISSMPQEPTGRTYVGSLTVPFRDFSFVIKCQCEEAGPTGFKEAVLLDRIDAPMESIGDQGDWVAPPDWNPDDEQHDAEFPDHPVARARRTMAHVAHSLWIAREMMDLPRFPLPL